ncbi:hypothetical protein FB451DRAFT_303325 [Mycena latifolia]|nr:hypothetical protein FB451DRAFT_109822 [Mycena latifolia]KAJ7472801.1 hypothetical protein FB451DRAFT_303325 [Mycena latifolia]
MNAAVEAGVDAEAGGADEYRIGAHGVSGESTKRRRTLVVFLRHFWCPVCQDYVVALARAVRAACAGADDSAISGTAAGSEGATSVPASPTIVHATSASTSSVTSLTSPSPATSTPASASASTSASPASRPLPTSTPATENNNGAASTSTPTPVAEPSPETQTQAETPRCPACPAHGSGSVTLAYLESLCRVCLCAGVACRGARSRPVRIS